MRLFFALPLPDAIQRELASLRTDLGKARWAPAAQLHVTLRFLGEVDDETADRVVAEVTADRQAAPWPTLRLAVRGLELFGGLRRPRVLFAGLVPKEPVGIVAASIERSVVRAGLAPEARPFVAHVTLARFARADTGRLSAFLRDRASFATEAFDVPEAILYRSTLTPSGAVHTPLHRFPTGS